MLFRGCVAVIAAVLFISSVPAPSYATDGAGLSLDIWRTPELFERLAFSGLVDSNITGIRPMARSEASRLLMDADERFFEFTAYGKEPPEGTAEVMAALKKAADTVHEDAFAYLKPMEGAKLSFVYLEGGVSFIPGINASQNSLIYNNEGIEPEEGLNEFFVFTMDGGAGPFTFSLTPLFSVKDGVASGVLHKGVIRLSVAGIDVEAGKESLWWGQGRHGGLFLTNNALPLTMIRITNPSPALLPWILSRLGPFRFDLFVSRLEEDRAVPKPYFAGLRFNFKPHPVLELGLTRTMIMGGKGRPGLTAKRLWEVMFGDNKSRGNDLSNSVAGIDFRLTLPFFQLYGEVGGEDEAGGYPSELAYIAGIYFPLPAMGVDFRFEYADISNKIWYRHGVYSTGYTYKGSVLGHHVGGSGRDFFSELGILRGVRLEGRISFDYEERGIETNPVTERHYQAGTRWSYGVGGAIADWSVEAAAYYEHITNAGFIAGVSENNSLVSIGLSGRL